MQTFLPYEDFSACARSLDDRRLGKQRVEVLQILNALLKPGAKGWVNHPCTNMWRGYEGTLVEYGVAICDEWTSRGFRDTVREKLLSFAPLPTGKPEWLGDPRLHASHRANLLRKDSEFYSHHGWSEDPEAEYFWPVRSKEKSCIALT